MTKLSAYFLLLMLGLMPGASGQDGSTETKISRPGVYSGYSPKLYHERVLSSVYITTRDGTRLAADIYRPAKDGKAVDTPYPVIWEGLTVRGKITPDGKANHFLMGPSNPKFAVNYKDLTDYGYVLAVV